MRLKLKEINRLHVAMENRVVAADKNAAEWGVAYDQACRFYHSVVRKCEDSPDKLVDLPLEFHGFYSKLTSSMDNDLEANALPFQAERNADYQPTTQSKSIMRNMRGELLRKFDEIAADTKSAREPGLLRAHYGTELRGQAGAGEMLRAIMRDSFQKAFWGGFAKQLGGGGRGMSCDEQDAVNLGLVDADGKGILHKSLTAGVSPGSLWLAEDVAKAVFDICPLYGAYKDLRVIQLTQGKTKFVKVTALPTAYWLIPSALQGTTITADTSMAGSAISQVCNTLAVNIEISMELLGDEKVDWGTAVLEKIARALAYGLDWASFAADGTADTTDGGQTGIFKHGDVPVVNAAAGHTTISALTHSDFMLAPAAIASAGLQRQCRWWVHPSFLAALLQLKDGNLWLCQTPAQNPSGEYSLCGFPMTLTAVAPSTGTAGLPVAAFGWGEAYSIGMREDAEIMTGAPKFNTAMKNIRALTRARCDMGDATMFAILKLAGT